MKTIFSYTLFIGALCVLVYLSSWQFQRLEWKKDIIQKLDSEYQKDPLQNVYSYAKLNALGDIEQPIRYGQVRGKFIFEKQILVGPKPQNNKIGYQVITPLKIKNNEYILVNRGWVDNDDIPKLRPITELTSFSVNGVIRKPDWNSFTPDNSPENDIWTKLDIENIARAKDIKNIAPVMMYAENDFDYITVPHSKKWYPRNKHSQYALFWACMALALIVVFGIFKFQKKS